MVAVILCEICVWLAVLWLWPWWPMPARQASIITWLALSKVRQHDTTMINYLSTFIWYYNGFSVFAGLQISSTFDTLFRADVQYTSHYIGLEKGSLQFKNTP